MPAVPAVPAVPSSEELTALLTRMIDPTVPDAEKVPDIQGIEDDPGLPNRIAESPRRNGTRIGITITSARLAPPGMLAEGTFTIDTIPPQPIIVNFVAEDGRWKIEKAWACQMAYTFMVQSTTCPA